MYEEHFGLKTNPFRGNAEGTGVFVGPTQTKIVERLHKALSASDNIVTVSGPVGIGKTTIVTRALETNKQHQMVAWIGRMRLAPDEVLQLLLAGFGITRQVPGTVRQFAVFQRLLSERAAADTRVVIVVEDALRIGDEALQELEAITATDTGNVGGANLILMGPPEIDKRLNFPELARLKQRSRMGQKIGALNVSEVQGYLKHCMRVAGKEFGALFDDDVVPMLYRLSEGTPRVINNICDAALAAAAEESLDRITSQWVLDVAADVYGLEPMLEEPSSIEALEMPEPAAEKLVDIEPVAVVEPEPTPEPEAEAELAPEPEQEPEPKFEQEPVPVSVFEPEPPPVTVTVATADPAPEPAPDPHVVLSVDDTASMPALDLPPIVAAALAQEEEEAPEQHSGIEITGLMPELNEQDVPADDQPSEAADTSADLPEPESFNDTADDLPMLSNSMRIDGPITPAPIDDATKTVEPAVVNKNPPVPDLDALEAAITAARGGDSQFDKTDTHLPKFDAEPVVELEAQSAPEIAAEPKPEVVAEIEPEPLPEPDPLPETESESAPEIESGPEQVPEIEASLEYELELEQIPELGAAPEFEPEPVPEPVPEAEPEPELAIEAEPAPQLDEVFEIEPLPEPVFEEEPAKVAEVVPEITLDQSLEDQRIEGNKLDAMAAELANVHSLEEVSDLMAETLFGIEFEQIAQEALKNPPAAGTLPGETDVLASPAIANAGAPANDPGEEPSPVMLDPEPEEPASSPTVSVPAINMLPPTDDSVAPVSIETAEPDTIENQFQTEITQTMKAIDPANLPNLEDEDDEKSSGLFGRLKKSFRG